MKRRNYSGFIADVYRYRPLAVVVLSLVVTLPALNEMFSQGLSALVVLLRLAEAFLFNSIVVWMVSAVLLRYARAQARARNADRIEGASDS